MYDNTSLDILSSKLIIGINNLNLVEDIDYLLPVKFYQKHSSTWLKISVGPGSWKV